jgi:hypothetical protein
MIAILAGGLLRPAISVAAVPTQRPHPPSAQRLRPQEPSGTIAVVSRSTLRRCTEVRAHMVPG